MPPNVSASSSGVRRCGNTDGWHGCATAYSTSARRCRFAYAAANMDRFDVAYDTAFRQVMVKCADRSRPGGWITREFVEAYTRLHELGWAHSVETYLGGELVGGVYGVRIGRFFAGESMFHTVTDASKVALVHLVDHLAGTGATLFDVQWTTPHLVSLGAVDVARDEYLTRLAAAVERA